jgi:hypothetical protein
MKPDDMSQKEYVAKLEKVLEAADVLVNIPPYPWLKKDRKEALRELTSKVNDIQHPLPFSMRWLHQVIRRRKK